MRRLSSLLAIILLTAAVHAQGDSWAGKTVITIRHDIRLTSADKKNAKTGTLLNDTISYRVLADRDGQIKVVTTQGVEGWFDKADAVPLDRAVAHFSEKLIRNPRDLSAMQKRAHAWELRGDYELALRDINEAIGLRPIDPAGWITRGSLYSSMRKYDKAIVDYSFAIRLKGHLTAGFTNRAEAWIGKKKYANAIDDCTNALRLDPKLAPALNHRGLAHFLSGEYERALADFDNSAKIDPTNGWLHKNRALMLATCKDAAYRDDLKAVEHALRALKYEPNPTYEFHETLAAAFAEARRFPEAIARQLLALEDPLIENDAAAKGRLELYRQQKAYRQE